MCCLFHFNKEITYKRRKHIIWFDSPFEPLGISVYSTTITTVLTQDEVIVNSQNIPLKMVANPLTISLLRWSSG